MPTFVIHEHWTSHHHFDFRLEIDGVLRSWAVPKEVPLSSGVRRLAVRVEDHPLDYMDFEGTIPKGEYGAGKVSIWDKGNYILKERTGKKIKFEAYGSKFRGKYDLIFMREQKGRDLWLLFKVG